MPLCMRITHLAFLSRIVTVKIRHSDDDDTKSPDPLANSGYLVFAERPYLIPVTKKVVEELPAKS